MNTKDGDPDSNKIIAFPRQHLRPEILSKVGKRRERAGRQIYLDEAINRYMEQAIDAYTNFGIDTSSDDFNRDLSHMFEGVQAIFYRHMEMQHRLHKYLDTGVKTENKATGECYWEFGADKKSKIPVPVNVANTANTIVVKETT